LIHDDGDVWDVLQGEAIDERACDRESMPECPGATPVLYIDSGGSSGESISLIGPQHRSAGEESGGGGDFHGQEEDQHHGGLNMSSTPGCECGCILYDLIPGRNDTLVIFISSNHSSPCADEDEVDHHKLKWILQVSQFKFILIPHGSPLISFLSSGGTSLG
jgi:hypothetical protein